MNGIHVMALPKAQKSHHGKVRRSQLLTCHGMCGSIYRDLPLSPLSSSKTETGPPCQLIALERGWPWVPGKCHWHVLSLQLYHAFLYVILIKQHGVKFYNSNRESKAIIFHASWLRIINLITVSCEKSKERGEGCGYIWSLKHKQLQRKQIAGRGLEVKLPGKYFSDANLILLWRLKAAGSAGALFISTCFYF